MIMSSSEGEEPGYHVDPRLVLQALENIRLSGSLPQAVDTIICESCSNMSNRILQGNSYRYPTSLWDLPVSTMSCTFCSLVEQCIRSPTAVNPATLDFPGALGIAGIDKGELVHLIIRPDESLLDLRFIRQGGDEEEELLTTSTIRLFTDFQSLAKGVDISVPFGMVVSPVPSLHNIATLVKTWTRDCQMNHRECNAPVQFVEPHLPTRVLDIGQVQLTGQLRLLHTDNMTGKYIALSHSWGGNQPTKSVKANLVARCTGFPLSELPPTFRDAVAVAAKLDVQYVWIDSLCIIQDDAEDWEREAAKMGDVYLHSYLTIAATRAINSEAGFLGPRISTRTAKLPSTMLGTQSPRVGNVYACQRRSFANDVDDGLLNRRAWVLQERVLSPRTLHFTENQVYWECWEYHQGEDLEYQYLGVMKKEAFPVGLSPNSLLGDTPQRRAQLPRGWWHMSSEYTSRGLTFQKDKLIAISGLVQKLESGLHLTYMKGVWKEYLHASVLWSARTKDLEHLPQVGAPSWSWASRNGPISYVQLYDHEPVSHFAIYEVHDRPQPSGILLVRASLAKLSSSLHVGEVRWSDPATDQIAYPPELDYFATRYRVVQNRAGDVLGWITLDVEMESCDEISNLRWVLVAKGSHSHEDKDVILSVDISEVKQNHYCLLVQENSDGHCRRVGVGSIETGRYLEFCNKSVLIA
ncbi:heterokaryon incompatibility protein-domain-containing protein [Xylaria palmicola]|nr:heterokaryon incompatibility protein-domain-containing protein [Xylaria palmicola]